MGFDKATSGKVLKEYILVVGGDIGNQSSKSCPRKDVDINGDERFTCHRIRGLDLRQIVYRHHCSVIDMMLILTTLVINQFVCFCWELFIK